jgi:putative Flp pilus-assembly TadE/G-like protein
MAKLALDGESNRTMLTRPQLTKAIQLRFRGDDGQVTIVVMLALSFFLMLFIGFGVDMTNVFFHRQSAQAAADSACVAGAMDMLVNQAQGAGLGGFTVGAGFDCSKTPTASPCQYAALNGYQSPGLTPGVESNDVTVSFPTTIKGAATPSLGAAGAYPFLQVDVYDRMRVYFSSWLSGSQTQDVHAFAKCGLQQANAPPPIVVLDPTCPHAFEVSGSATVKLIGGPQRSIQVNSGNETCAAATQGSGCSGNGTIDLSQGGPNFTGSAFGVWGAPNSAPRNFLPGSTGQWQSPAAPVPDPWRTLVAPDPTSLTKNPATRTVAHTVNGCPDIGGCTEYSPGWYASAIVVKGFTAIFDPGVYYITGTANGNCGTPGTGCLGKSKPTGLCRYGLIVDSNGIVRPSTAVGDGTGGTMFYFSGTGAGTYGSAFFGANAGSRAVDAFSGSLVTCPGGTAPSPPLPASLQGDVLLGPCAGPYGLTRFRGMLFWDDRANADLNGQPSMQGGGGLLLAGNLYFHNCPEAPNVCAQPPTDYNAFFNLQGTPGSSTYIFGDITTDELIEGGNGTISMQLNPNQILSMLKVALLQ